ncbi:STM4011 family radical SAM protein [Paenibacillus sp. PAMC 26794]|uniref:STM4011 family radical SAM protein n=1 Tax=Paenibacillus sp. PAMC 26794 TaxID=1257080 RepID=UPI00036E9E6D|nr:STM4011 family radical SAM protein [Paenibacillus sp. PAMC 26794]
MRATLYYRGKLSSCNYDCPYCPFSKTVDSKETLEVDEQQLRQFVNWVREQESAGDQFSIFFNPYGEALVRRWYREALVELSHMPHVDKVAIQTNLSVKLDWARELDTDKAAFWATYHPRETKEASFVKQCLTLRQMGLAFSVGTVGLRSAFPAIESMRQALPDDVYMWVNAFKDRPKYYTPEDIQFLRGLDPLFEGNLQDYESLGKRCAAGSEVFYVQGSGHVKRCYKDRRIIGHLYRDGVQALAADRPCRMKKCGCYIGYIHMEDSPFRETFGSGLLERNPVWINR